MEGYGTMPGAAMACMTASLLIAFGLPLGLGLFFPPEADAGGAFLLGAAVFLVLPWWAGHGGMEAVLVGLTNVSNLLLSFWLKRWRLR